MIFRIVVTAIAIVVVAIAALWIATALAHDIYRDLTKNTRCTCSNDDRLCEPVEAIPIDGKRYYLPASGETLPASTAMPSPDDRFHRCTWPYNRVWKGRGAGQGPEGWINVPDNSTPDGKPKTLCFFAPVVGY